MYWLISDTHFYHKNIARYCGRPENHNELMLAGLDDIPRNASLIHVGDVAFVGRAGAERLWQHFPEGEKVLIMGNHDKRSKIAKILPWNKVVKPVDQPYRFDYKGLRIAISHRPMPVEDCDIYIHGHIHELGQQLTWSGRKLVVNACVEHWNYEPFTLGHIVDCFRGNCPDAGVTPSY